jgi:hypothetical protein
VAGEAERDARQDVQWSPRVPKWKLRRLYERAARGIWDEDLAADVGTMLYLRCRDMLAIQRAQDTRQVTCPRCDRAGRATFIARRGGRDALMRCPVCGWAMTWRAYRRTFHRRQLNPGGAVGYFRDYVAAFEAARSPRDRFLAVDRLIHEFHYSLRSDPTRPTRPAAVNLIVGDLKEVAAFLDQLGGRDLPEPLARTRAAWRQKFASTYWPQYLAKADEPKGDSRCAP